MKRIGGRPLEALIANAGRGLGKGFLDQDFKDVMRVVNTNVTGTIYLIQKVRPRHARQKRGQDPHRWLHRRVHAGDLPSGLMPPSAFLDSFSFALRAEIGDCGVTVTCLMPGATETEFFERADMLDTKIGQSKKDDPADVAATGFNAMMKGEGDVVSGWHNKLQSAIALVTPSSMLVEQHRKKVEPGSARH